MSLNVTNLNILDCPDIYEDFMIKFMADCNHDEVWNSSLIKRSDFADEVARGRARVGALTVRTSSYDAAEFSFMDTTSATCPTSGDFTEASMLARKVETARKYSAENAMNYFLSCNAEDPLMSYFNDVSGPYWRTMYGQMALIQLIAGYKALAADAVNGPESILDAVGGVAANAATGLTGGLTSLNQVTLNSADNLVSCSVVDSLIMHQAVATNLENQGMLNCQCVQNDIGAVSYLYSLNDGRPVTVIRDSATKALLAGSASATLPAPLTNLGFDGAAGTYLTILYREGVIHYGEGCHPRPLEIDSTPCAGAGSGAEEIYERRRFVLHLEGFSFVGENGQGGFTANDNRSPNFVDFGTAGNWQLSFPIERLPVKYIITDLN